MTDRELALNYAPHLYYDKNEPFPIDQIGYSIIPRSQRSPSFDRDILFNERNIAFVIEYQMYFDYDIQHMYDLEHFWVYVDHDGNVVNAEASAHGFYTNCYQYTMTVEDKTHIPLYVQPGKHAFLPEGNMFKLFSDYKTACNIEAGIGGLLAAGMFKDKIMKNSYIDYKVCEHIRKEFIFEPTLEFHYIRYDESIIIKWEDLFAVIPQRIRNLLEGLGLN